MEAGLIAIGLMSGTSMDGIDAALVRVERPATGPPGLEPVATGSPRIDLLDFLCRPYGDGLGRRLREAAAGRRLSAGDLGALDVEVGEVFGAAARELRDRAARAGRAAEVIGSHGQTIAHDPARGVSMQIGSAAVIAERTGIPVVYDFRARDLAAGGQGAPHVPFVDRLLFADPQRTVAALNLGGIANLTVLPAGAELEAVRAFDTGPGNMVVDEVVRALTGGRASCDRDGVRAGRGRADPGLLERLLRDPFFEQGPPKSTGAEAFGAGFAVELIREGRARGLADDDLVATATALTVESVGRAVRGSGAGKLWVSGGGVHNPALLGGLRRALPAVEIDSTLAAGIDPDAKEALAFAVLAWAHLAGAPAGLPSVTGAGAGRVLGARVP